MLTPGACEDPAATLVHTTGLTCAEAVLEQGCAGDLAAAGHDGASVRDRCETSCGCPAASPPMANSTGASATWAPRALSWQDPSWFVEADVAPLLSAIRALPTWAAGDGILLTFTHANGSGASAGAAPPFRAATPCPDRL